MASEQANVVTEVTETVSRTTVVDEPEVFEGYQPPERYFTRRTLLDDSPPRRGLHAPFSIQQPTVQKVSRQRTSRRRPPSAGSRPRSAPFPPCQPAPNIMDMSPPRYPPPALPRPPSPPLMGERPAWSAPVPMRPPQRFILDESPPRGRFPSPLRPRSPQLMNFPETPAKQMQSAIDFGEFEDLYCPGDYEESDFEEDDVETSGFSASSWQEESPAPSRPVSPRQPRPVSPRYSPGSTMSSGPLSLLSGSPGSPNLMGDTWLTHPTRRQQRPVSPPRSPQQQPKMIQSAGSPCPDSPLSLLSERSDFGSSPVSPRVCARRESFSRVTRCSPRGSDSPLSLLSNMSEFGSPASPGVLESDECFGRLTRTSESPRGSLGQRARQVSPREFPSPRSARGRTPSPRAPSPGRLPSPNVLTDENLESDFYFDDFPVFEDDEEYFAQLDAVGIQDRFQDVSPTSASYSGRGASPQSSLCSTPYSVKVSEPVYFDTPPSYSDVDDIFDKMRFTPGSDGRGRMVPRKMTPGGYRMLGRAEKDAEYRAIQKIYDQDRQKLESEMKKRGVNDSSWRRTPGSPQPGCSYWPPVPPQRWTPTKLPARRHLQF